MVFAGQNRPAGKALDKMHPACLKLVSIIQKCKLKQAIITAGNIVGKEEKDAFSLSFIRREIGEFERKSNERAPGAQKPNGYLRKRIADQVAGNSLEWATWGKSINMKEFTTLKNENSSKSNIIENVDGTLHLCNKYEGFAADPESIRRAETPYFPKASKLER